VHKSRTDGPVRMCVMTHESSKRRATTTLKNVALLSLFVLIIGNGTSAASTITFGGLVGANFDPFASYNEAGFTVTALSGNWFEAHLFGNPVPDIFSNSDISSIGVIRQGGGSFNFFGVDLGNAGSSGSQSYLIEGLLSNSVLFSQSGTLPGDVFTQVASASNLSIDLLRISLNRQGAASYNIDNINVNTNTSPVPEPASLLLLGTGLVGTFVRRRFGA
jgi:PEP-CTERM motif